MMRNTCKLKKRGQGGALNGIIKCVIICMIYRPRQEPKHDIEFDSYQPMGITTTLELYHMQGPPKKNQVS